MHWALLLFFALLTTSCGRSHTWAPPLAEAARQDASVVNDVSVAFDSGVIRAVQFPRDAATVDSATWRDSAPLDATSNVGEVGDGYVAGTVAHERRVRVGAQMVATVVPTAGVQIALLVNDIEVSRTLTDSAGGYRFTAPTTIGVNEIRIYASNAAIAVTDFARNEYVVRVPAGSYTIPETMQSGAFSMVLVTTNGMTFAQRVLPRTYPRFSVRWQRGQTTPGGTSYAEPLRSQTYILGGPIDTDEFDDTVLLHELGHLVQYANDFNGDNDGTGHNQENSSPGAAFNEGWPTFFAAAVRGDSLYWDSEGDRFRVEYDIAALPLTRRYMGDPAGMLTQTLSEQLVSSTLYRMWTATSPEEQIPLVFGSVRARLTTRQLDRSVRGPDLVDAVDAYLCASTDQPTIQTYLVAERQFPYDFAGTCLKPGPQDFSIDASQARAPLGGRVLQDSAGTWIREFVPTASPSRSPMRTRQIVNAL